jgi:hypothetical protein
MCGDLLGVVAVRQISGIIVVHSALPSSIIGEELLRKLISFDVG